MALEMIEDAGLKFRILATCGFLRMPQIFAT